MTDDSHPRELVGHGANPPHARWPGGARIAVQFVLNVEEGGENNGLHGDPSSETFLSEPVTAQHIARHSSVRVARRIDIARHWKAVHHFSPPAAPATGGPGVA